MVFGLQLSVGFNFTTIRFLGYGINPMHYAIFPFCALLTMAAIQMLLPAAVGINTKSAEFLTLMKIGATRVEGGKKKYITRILKAMRDIKLYAGVDDTYFFNLDKTVQGTYMNSILDWTVTLLMTFPAASMYTVKKSSG